jgi:mRNA interferase RelE/StbE
MIHFPYQLRYSPEAERFLDKLRDRDLVRHLYQALDKLRQNPYPSGCKKMAGRPDYRVRVGDYRIIYRVFHRELLVEIIKIGDRKDVYR